jgi:flagellar assembly factor FliW
MPQCETKYFGPVSYGADAAIEFPAGLPGFESRRRFLPVEEAAHRPLIFLQSLEEPRLCFITVPVLALDPGYCVKLSAEDLAILGVEKAPAMGKEALCLAVVSMAEGARPTANLLAPIVVSWATRRAVQAVRDDALYGCCHPLAGGAGAQPCS